MIDTLTTWHHVVQRRDMAALDARRSTVCM
jgi:hypothetical protein